MFASLLKKDPKKYFFNPAPYLLLRVESRGFRIVLFVFISGLLTSGGLFAQCQAPTATIIKSPAACSSNNLGTVRIFYGGAAAPVPYYDMYITLPSRYSVYEALPTAFPRCNHFCYTSSYEDWDLYPGETLSINFVTSGSEYVGLNNNGCTWEGNFTFTMPTTSSPPVPTMSVFQQPTCPSTPGGFTITNYNAAYTYMISPSGATRNGATVTAPPGNYSVTASNGVCSIQSGAIVLINPQSAGDPVPNNIVSGNCATPNGSFINTDYTQAFTDPFGNVYPAPIYNITPSTGVSQAYVTGKGWVVTAPAGVTYTVRRQGYTVSNASYCTSNPVTVTIPLVDGSVAPTFSNIVLASCTDPNSSFTITNYSSSYNYSISPSTGVSINGAVLTVPSGFNYTVTATLGSCSKSSVIAVAAQRAAPVAPTLAAGIVPTYAVPTGTFTITNYNAAYTYTVAPSTGVTRIAGTVTAPGGITYTVTATGPGGCSSTSLPLSLAKVYLTVNAKALLQGPWNGTTMNTTLNSLQQLPANQPYVAAPFNHANSTIATESVNVASFFSANPNIVDWVLVELRDPVTPSVIISQRAAFLKNDGSIVDMDGVSPLYFGDQGKTSFHVAIRHRNHLPVRTSTPITPSAAGIISIDFTTGINVYDNSTVTGNAPMVFKNGKYLLWGGDVNGDGVISASGSSNDISSLLRKLGGDITFSISPLYDAGDVNMNGTISAFGSGNDRAWIISNVLGGDISITISPSF